MTRNEFIQQVILNVVKDDSILTQKYMPRIVMSAIDLADIMEQRGVVFSRKRSESFYHENNVLD